MIICRASNCIVRGFCRHWQNDAGPSDRQPGEFGLGCDSYEPATDSSILEIDEALVAASQNANRGGGKDDWDW